MQYEQFLRTKEYKDLPTGKEAMPFISKLYDFQSALVTWALARGRAALFTDTGTGKTHMELEWAQQVPGRVLIFAPLAVATQTADIAEAIGISAKYLRHDDKSVRIVITNYEMIEHFDPKDFTGIVLDESSILKSFNGTVRSQLIEWASGLAWKLTCSATPGPNDYMELGNHAEFLGVMKYTEMLATFFINDGGETAQWRLKTHGQDKFWKWISSWAVFMNKPEDLGFEGHKFELPMLVTKVHPLSLGSEFAAEQGRLFVAQVSGLNERRQIRKQSIDLRVNYCLDLLKTRKGPAVIWCDFNDESDALAKALPNAVVVKGSDSLDVKIERLSGFQSGKYEQLITKPSIAGFGMNWQHCSQQYFVGLSDSFERYYQAVRRCWRYGQTKPVFIDIIVTEAEMVVVENVAHKEEQLRTMRDQVVKYTKEHIKSALLNQPIRDNMEYKTDTASGAGWKLLLGDCVERLKEIEDESVDYSIFSPPFAELYVYSNSERDMGNSKSRDEFAEHFRYLIPDLMRVTKPGRLLSFHCMQLPIAKYKEGHIGIFDFRGELIRAFREHGWIYHSEVCIWKDPVTAMHRTKALGLLHKQIKKDSSMSRQGIADYLVTMRKPGVNPEPIAHTDAQFPVQIWQNYASPVWMDINPSKTLQFRSARDNNDEKHICPLQLEVIERALDLWTNPEDLVLSPFAGIGSEGYVSLQKGRRFIGIELKESYWKAAKKNLATIENSPTQLSLYPGGAA